MAVPVHWSWRLPRAWLGHNCEIEGGSSKTGKNTYSMLLLMGLFPRASDSYREESGKVQIYSALNMLPPPGPCLSFIHYWTTAEKILTLGTRRTSTPPRAQICLNETRGTAWRTPSRVSGCRGCTWTCRTRKPPVFNMLREGFDLIRVWPTWVWSQSKTEISTTHLKTITHRSFHV